MAQKEIDHQVVTEYVTEIKVMSQLTRGFFSWKKVFDVQNEDVYKIAGFSEQLALCDIRKKWERVLEFVKVALKLRTVLYFSEFKWTSGNVTYLKVQPPSNQLIRQSLWKILAAFES